MIKRSQQIKFQEMYIDNPFLCQLQVEIRFLRVYLLLPFNMNKVITFIAGS